jgi:hypothetical protein
MACRSTPANSECSPEIVCESAKARVAAAKVGQPLAII